MLLEPADPSTMSETKEIRFPTSNWKHIFALLGLMIVADKKALDAKVETYLDVIIELRTIIDPAACFTRHMAQDWFVLNRPYLEEVVESLTGDNDTVLCNIIAPIKTMPHILDVITGMVKIALSDGEYSISEKGVMKKTMLYMNITRITFDQIDSRGTMKCDEKDLVERTVDNLWEASAA